MSGDEDRFNRTVVEVVAKRAAFRCSNPDCGATTTGPASEDVRAIIVGEAAHIYGARPGSARYNSDMSSANRAATTNAIWLCRNCHKLVDADPVEFTADLLFEWRLEHEGRIRQEIGKTSDLIRQKIIDQELEGFGRESYLARQIVIDKPYGWEFRLTSELLRTKIKPIRSRWKQLERRMYSRPIVRPSDGEFLNWILDRLAEVTNIPTAISEIMNVEFAEAWGPPGQPGSPSAILNACDLLSEACQQLLNWEENVTFSAVSDEFDEIKSLLSGVGGRMLDQVWSIPGELDKVFSEERPTGEHKIEIIIDPPPNWSEEVSAAIARLKRRRGL